VGNCVPTFCRRGPHLLFRACNRKGCLIFCMCVVVVLIFVSPALCCAPSHMCFYFILLSAIFIVCICVPHLRAGFLPAFVLLLIHLLWGGPCVGFRLLVGVRSALVWAFVLRSRTHYLFIPYPSNYTFVRWHVCLSNR
jgi:hypothetical protein